MIVGIPKETFPGERRVAVTPDVISQMARLGIEFLIEKDAGLEAGYRDSDYTNKKAKIAASRSEVFTNADVVLQVRSLGANLEEGKADMSLHKQGQVVIGFQEPLTEFDALKQYAEAGVTLMSMELMPRITRGQSMDALSSMATIAGYKAVLMAASTLPRMFPMTMTAAGTLKPAKAFVIGAGVAGLQAIATAKRLGAVVKGYDVRPAVKEQVESLGAKFVEMELETSDSEDKGGYAKAMDEEFYRKQRELMTKVLEDTDVVFTTAAIPGKKAPILITREMVEVMGPGSVIVDLAAERGGNCEITKPGETVVHKDVSVLGPMNLPSAVPYHASQMYSKNITTFLKLMIKEEKIEFDMEDEIITGTMLTRDGNIVHPRVLELMGETPPVKEEAKPETEGSES